MIYGLNFNGQAIPPAIERMWPREMKIYRCANCGKEMTRRVIRMGSNELCKPGCGLAHQAWIPVRGQRSRLAGVGQSEQERDAMLIQATNGHRQLHVEPKQTAAGVWYGIYTF